MIKKISISGFRNFPDKPILNINLIKEGLILIGGHNAKGKTSIFHSLGFIFGGNKGFYAQNRIRNFVNSDPNIHFALVKIILDNSPQDGIMPFPGILEEEVTIERLMGKKGNQEDYIKFCGKQISPSELRDILRRAHINPDNPYQFVGQEQLTSIISKSPPTIGSINPDKLKIM